MRHWREKKSKVHKTMFPFKKERDRCFFKERKPKLFMRSIVSLRKLDFDEMETGCNVVFARFC